MEWDGAAGWQADPKRKTVLDTNVSRYVTLIIQSESSRGSIGCLPQFYGSQSYVVATEPEAIESARGIYVPPEHQVFMLVPDSFRLLADEMMELGSLDVVQERVWELYLELIQMFHARGIVGDPEWTEFVNMAPEQKDRPDEEEDIPDEPIPAEQPLQWNEHIQYYGGVNGGLGQPEWQDDEWQAEPDEPDLPDGEDLDNDKFWRAEGWADEVEQEYEDEEDDHSAPTTFFVPLDEFDLQM
ncbi:hypothetical protein EV421DRAFT_1907859 [Armillaria borealis]|uniref:Uncharacterized protein n=1 Tax=Armillaria borealis TaxID=47425 RepID=A0AA39MJD5_9AGAR|nr:hypothetical protein EV421DRAFT_1907859 [Armillaria borealis]